MTMNLAVQVPTSNAFVSPAQIVDDMVTTYGCTVEYEVANAMGKVWGRVVNAGHASLVTMNVIKYNNPARHRMFHGVGRKLIRAEGCSQSFCAAAGPCHLVDEMKARGKHTITFDSQEPWQRASRFMPPSMEEICSDCTEIYLYAEDMYNNGDGMLSEAVTFSVPPSNWLGQSLELTSTPTAGTPTDGVSFSFAGGAQVLLTKDVALATVADIKAGTYAMGTGSCRQDDVNVGMSVLYWTLSGCSLTALVDYSVVLYVEDMAGMDDGQLSSLQLIVPSAVSNYFVETPCLFWETSPQMEPVTLSFNAQAASGMAWGFILEARPKFPNSVL
ncbi:ptprf [Symbiodinium necroappetens]|uniref:Ptprf protein n=1 Tax=Symbiodinium necroappetens TaxID=1628268 RepID=A0A812WF05_9DINO|nr:ptprf [Symbiodinium necroappetens]